MNEKTAQVSDQASVESKTSTAFQEKQPSLRKHPPLIFLILLFGLIGIFVYGLQFVFSLGSGEVGSVPFLLFDYTVGLTMIFLPCTLPLAFVIVPLVMGKSYTKGIGMTVAFGLGVTITLSFYGVLIGLFGQALGVSQVETAKNILYAVAGLLAILFAFGELKLIRFSAPVYGGSVPQFIMNQKDLSKAFFLGLFLGNVGVGCPNPLFNAVIIPQIIVEGSAFQGWLIMFVQALGRITPLFILAFLAILGINATKFLVAHKDTVSRITAWSTIYVGGFLLTLGLFGHDWWVISGMHTLVEFVTQENFITNLLGSKVQELGHTHGIPAGVGLFGIPIAWGTPFILFIWIFPMLWYYLYKKKTLLALPPEQQAFEKRFTRLVGWFFAVVSLWLITVFGSYLPHMFIAHWSQGHMDAGQGGFQAKLSSMSGFIIPNSPFVLKVSLVDDQGNPITDLKSSHERILHIILISEDLEDFRHVHPEDFGQVGVENLSTAVFNIPLTLSKNGRYRVLIDANRLGNEVSVTDWLNVEGNSFPLLIDKDLSRDKLFDGYRVVLNVQPRSPKTGEEIHLSYYIEKDGRRITDTEPYLGADMHLAIAPLDLSIVSHTHGLKSKSTKDNPLSEIDAHYTFPFPGLWKIYGQFQHKGRVITTDFMVEVEPGTMSAEQMAPHMDDH